MSLPIIIFMEQCSLNQGDYSVIDAEGFRLDVGMIVTNDKGQVLWARRIKQTAWQFPQGGLNRHETPEQALFRELHEELGLEPFDVRLLGHTKGWLYYWLPRHLRRSYLQPLCIGQKQKWFLLKLIGDPAKIRFDMTPSPEFDRWRWVPYFYPIKQVINFKWHVYRRALEELAPFIGLVFSSSQTCKAMLREKQAESVD